jgi:CelD/BcsL family acetyltransferase involved in cellulose biosynthesis
VLTVTRQAGNPASSASAQDSRDVGLEVTVKHCFDYSGDVGNDWDELVANSTSDFIFQTSCWLRACIDTYGNPARVLIPEIRRSGRLVAAAAFRERDGIIEFAGIDRSDMCDLLLSRELDDDDAIEAANALLSAVRKASKRFRYFLLARVPVENHTVRRLLDPRFHQYPRLRCRMVAPSMDMSVAAAMLRKKSLRRHENSLKQVGKLESYTHSRAADIIPDLDEFFAQHIDRWAHTRTPSLFLEARNREFYRRVIENLDLSGWLRFTVLRLDGQMVAAHFGWLYAGRFCWYKPTFDIDRKKFSPGEVLLKRAIEQAQADHAEEFDFLLGSEAYKRRFSTRERELVSLEIYPSWFAATAMRVRRGTSHRLRRLRRKLAGRA